MKRFIGAFTLLISFSCLFVTKIDAQTPVRCYSNEMHQQLLQQFPELESQSTFENWISSKIQQMQSMAITTT